MANKIKTLRDFIFNTNPNAITIDDIERIRMMASEISEEAISLDRTARAAFFIAFVILLPAAVALWMAGIWIDVRFLFTGFVLAFVAVIAAALSFIFARS
jgi:hypothetical protein